MPPPRSKNIQYASGEEWRTISNSSRKNEAAGPKWKWCSVAGVSGSDSKVWFYKEQHCIGTWNVRSINQDKLDMVKQEMARVNISILGISELKWMGMGEFNSDDHYIYYYRPESLGRNGVALFSQKKCPKHSFVFWYILKNNNDFSSFPGQTIQHHSNPRLCSNHQSRSSWSWPVLWRTNYKTLN